MTRISSKYFYELLIIYKLHILAVQSLMKNLSELSRGRFHCYTSTDEEQIYTGDDISRLLKEVKEAQNIINKIKDMRRGLLGAALVSIMDEVWK